MACVFARMAWETCVCTYVMLCVDMHGVGVCVCVWEGGDSGGRRWVGLGRRDEDTGH